MKTQVTVRLELDELLSIDELVNRYNAKGGSRATRQTVIADLIARGIRTVSRETAHAGTSSAQPGIESVSVSHESGE